VALNPDFVGRTYPPVGTYQVGREKIREFATAIGDSNPLFHDVDAASAAGYADVIAPPTFAFALAFQAMRTVVLDPQLGLDYSRVVHGEEKFVYSRPIGAGDELVVSSVIDNIRAAAGNDMITVRSDIATVTGEHVVTTYSLTVARGTA
jgi:acyl dehydratase